MTQVVLVHVVIACTSDGSNCASADAVCRYDLWLKLFQSTWCIHVIQERTGATERHGSDDLTLSMKRAVCKSLRK